MTDEEKKWIDDASYIELLRRWRTAPSGDPMFQGDTGAYYQKIMLKRKREIGQAGHVQASKEIGW